MGVLIDELIVALRLDPKDFKKGEKEAASAFLKTRDQAVKSGKDVEAASNKVAASIQKMAREVITLFAVIAGSRSLADLISGLTLANSELGRFSANMAESPQQVAAWQAAAQRFGGTGQVTAETIQRMGKALYDLRFQGKALPQAFYQLEAATGRLISTDKGPIAFLEQTSAALKNLAATDPARAFNIAQELGIDPGTFALMKDQGAAVGAYVAVIEKSISPSGRAIKAAQDLQNAWFTLTQQVGSLINKLYELAGPPITDLINKMTAWLGANKDWLASEISDKVAKFADYLAKIDWNAVGAGLKSFGDGAKSAADAVGGLTNALEIMFGLWAGGKAAKFLFGGAIASGAAAGGGAAAAGGAGIGGLARGLLGRVSPWIAMLSLSGDSAKNAGSWRDDPRADEWVAQWAKMRGIPEGPGSGPHGRGPGRDRGDRERQNSLDGFLNGPVDGRPVSKSNPLPVMPVSNEVGGGGFWSNLWKGITGAMSGASAGPMGSGGSLISAGASGGGLAGGSDFAVSGRSAGERGWWTKDRQRQAYQMLTEGGVSPHGAKGLISRWMNVEASGGPSSVNSIGATGIAQWLGSRKAGMLQHARELGKDWRDFETQVKYVLKEINSGKAGGGSESALRTARNDREGAIAASRFERAEGYNPRTGVDNFTGRTAGGMRGMDSYLLRPEQPGIATGAKGSAAISSANNDNRRYANSVSSNTSIGNMNIHTQASDPHGIADAIWGDIDKRMKHSANATAANFGPT